MLGRLNHVAIAVPDLAAAAKRYQDLLGLGTRVSPPQELPEHGVRVVFIELENTKIELLEPLGADSPIAPFLERHPQGGIHHLCCEVENIAESARRLKQVGVSILEGGKPQTGAHGKPVLFLHPRDFNATLIELEQR